MNPSISFSVSAPSPHDHLFRVAMEIDGLEADEEMVLRMPVWTPGSYLIREYPKHVQQVAMTDGDGTALFFEKIDKASWRVDLSGADALRMTYQVYAHELSPRHNHLDGTHGFFNCVATCMYPDGGLDQPVELVVRPPAGWEVFCGLSRQPGEGVRFVARDFDELFDTPVEMGPHRWFDFQVRGVEHRFVVWGGEHIDMDSLRRDLPVIVERNFEMFDDVPYERYVFINHVIKGVWGGLEHRHSSVNVFGPENFDRTERDDDGEYGEKYANLLRLWSHEHFHAYHVKRLRPEALGPFDYQRENYTRSLWAVEGVASYFDTYQLLQAGLIGPARYVALLEKKIKRLYETPGRLFQSLEDASFDAWIGLYRRDENTPNSSVSYYLKGELVTWLIDLWIRAQTDGEHSMADVLRGMWKQYYVEGDVGFPRGAVQQAVSAVSGADATPVFEHLVRSCEEIHWEDYLAAAGLRLRPVASEEGRGWLALKPKTTDEGRVEIRNVYRGGPAERAGIYPGDEVIAVDGWSVRGEDLAKMVAPYAPGDTMELHLIRRGRLVVVEVECGELPPASYSLEVVEDPSHRQLELLRGWLGVTEWKES